MNLRANFISLISLHHTNTVRNGGWRSLETNVNKTKIAGVYSPTVNLVEVDQEELIQ